MGALMKPMPTITITHRAAQIDFMHHGARKKIVLDVCIADEFLGDQLWHVEMALHNAGWSGRVLGWVWV